MDTFNEISSRVNYDSPLSSITTFARIGLGITKDMSKLAESFIGIYLKADVYAWKGKAAKQFEYLKNGIRIVYPGELVQLWIPNLTLQIAGFKFFHSI